MNMRRIRTFLMVLSILLVIPGGMALAQEPFTAEGIPPGSDYVYRKHYEQVQEIMAAPLAEREAKLDAYRKKCHPDSKILQYMEAFFGQILEAYKAGGQSAKADALTQKMMQMFPKSDALTGKQFQQAFEAKDYAKAIELGEKVRAKSPNDPATLSMLAASYSATKNMAKLREISPKVIQVLGVSKAINYVAWLADDYRQKNDVANAMKYYDMALAEYPTRAPQGWQAADWNNLKVTALQLRASTAWQREDYGAVVNTYSEVLKINPKSDTAYLFMGLSYWKMQELDQAQVAFARAAVLGGSQSAKARQYLEQIYKPRNNNSLDGLDKVLAKAKADMGV